MSQLKSLNLLKPSGGLDMKSSSKSKRPLRIITISLGIILAVIIIFWFFDIVLNGMIVDLSLIHIFKAQGKTIIVSEHRLYFLNGIADRIVLMELGKMKKVWTAKEFQQL